MHTGIKFSLIVTQHATTVHRQQLQLQPTHGSVPSTTRLQHGNEVQLCAWMRCLVAATAVAAQPLLSLLLSHASQTCGSVISPIANQLSQILLVGRSDPSVHAVLTGCKQLLLQLAACQPLSR
jgi:hypothetical protein